MTISPISLDEPRIIITGTGRAGTTFLVRLLTELGLDTGFTRETWVRSYDEHCAAGLEHTGHEARRPRIIKNPALCETLDRLVRERTLRVAHAIVPIRELGEVAASRATVGGSGATPGGLWGATQIDEQRSFLAEKFHQLMHTLAVHEIPCTLLQFPRFVRDPAYLQRQLAWLLAGVSEADFRAAFARTAQPELVHDFSAGLPADAGAPAERYTEAERAKQRRRVRRRVMRGLVGAAVAGLVITAWLAG